MSTSLQPTELLLYLCGSHLAVCMHSERLRSPGTPYWTGRPALGPFIMK